VQHRVTLIAFVQGLDNELARQFVFVSFGKIHQFFSIEHDMPVLRRNIHTCRIRVGYHDALKILPGHDRVCCPYRNVMHRGSQTMIVKISLDGRQS
jgi:hypothetical protein